VVDVVDINKRPTEVYLVAKAIGETNVFFIGADGNVMLHVEAVVQIALEGAKAALAAIFPDGGIHLNSVNKSIVISGTAGSAQESANAASVVRAFVQSDTEVINTLRIIGDQQVLLKVRIAEIQRTVVKTLGSDLTIGSTNNFFAATAGAFAGPAAKGFGVVFAKLAGVGLKDATISALESRGLAKTLAEPALVAISGETANFLAGGEFPVPVDRDKDTDIVTIVFKKFGVSLSFTPVVLSKSQINLRINTEVSRIDPSQKVGDIQGLSVRRADSTVSLTSGGSLMIAGLLQNDEFNDIEGLPWFKDIPVLGALFSSKGFQNNQTELVIMVTAYIVRPTQPGTELAAPTDGFVPASDFDFYLMGQLYKRYAKQARPETVPMVQGPVGYLME
jgi:pilus assembly protein CpaC